MSTEKEIPEVERIVYHAANSLGVAVHVVRSSCEGVSGNFNVEIEHRNKNRLLHISQKCFAELRDNSSQHRMTELKAKIKRLLAS